MQMIKFQVYESDGKALFTDDFKVEDVSFDGSVIYAEIDDLHVIDFNNWKRVYRDYGIVNDKRFLKSMTIFY